MTWDQLRHFHKQPKVIAAWARALGPLLRWLTPPRRRILLSLAALYVAVRFAVRTMDRAGGSVGTTPELLGSVALLAVLLGFVLACVAAAKNFAALPAFVRRHPQISLHAILWMLLAYLWTADPAAGPLRTLLYGCVFALPFLLWRVGYMMFAAQRGRLAGTGLKDHLFYIFPIWGGSDTPYGKGYDYLAANEARDETALAKSQLAGIKLFILAGACGFTKDVLKGTAYGENNYIHRALGGVSFGVPRLGDMLADPAAYPPWLCWIGLYFGLIWAVLSLAASGHLIIGWLRFSGFYVFRNTYKPLLADSVVEFWNRYYYYFKELLVNFFFFPTFTRTFKAYPRLRMFAAVFAAAFVGNMYYHWMRFNAPLAAGDFPAMWAVLQSRLFYCVLLALGIYVSMQRQQLRAQEKAARRLPRRILAIFGVWTFFSVIHIWAEEDPADFATRSGFFLRLIGLG